MKQFDIDLNEPCDPNLDFFVVANWLERNPMLTITEINEKVVDMETNLEMLLEDKIGITNKIELESIELKISKLKRSINDLYSLYK